jgi:uncharacterized protein
MHRINRQYYLDFLVRNKDRQIIKVVSGVRRCGKSTLFEIYRDYLLKCGVAQAQITYINFEELDNADLADYKQLYKYLKNKLLPDRMNYIFLDEIQVVAQFEKAVDSLFIKKNVDLYLTGSNGWFMSGELATLLTGRFLELQMLPLSFFEYREGMQAMGIDLPRRDLFEHYIQDSSFPFTLQLQDNPKEFIEYLRGIYNSILVNDVISRQKITDMMMLGDVVRFVFDNIGSQLSSLKIANTMSSEGRKIDSRTVEKYLQGLMDSLLIYQAKRYDVKGKQYLASLEKYYVADLGIRQLLLGKRRIDLGHMLENVVYLELLRRGNQVYVGSMPGGEIDFVAQYGMNVKYYQVSATVMDEKTLARELASFKKINDNHPKFLLTMDDIIVNRNIDGILHLNVLEWLLGEETENV